MADRDANQEAIRSLKHAISQLESAQGRMQRNDYGNLTFRKVWIATVSARKALKALEEQGDDKGE